MNLMLTGRLVSLFAAVMMSRMNWFSLVDALCAWGSFSTMNE